METSHSTHVPAAEATARFREILTKFDNAMLVTHRPGSEFHGRPMAVAQVEPDGTLWFMTSIDAPKLVEIGADPHVLVCMQGGFRFATVNGKVAVVRDRSKIDELWKEAYRVWFDGKDDPKLVLLRLTPHSGEYWDQSGIRGLKYAFKAAKALVTDEKPRVNEPEMHASVKL